MVKKEGKGSRAAEAARALERKERKRQRKEERKLRAVSAAKPVHADANVPTAAAPAAPPAPDRDRIERAVAFINERARTIRGELLAIGEYLLREFFDGDPRAVRSKDPRKLGSFRDLAGRDDCLLSYSTLWRAVNLAIQERELGTVAPAQQLSPSHKIELLALDDPGEKRRMVVEAVEEGWSTKELRKEVRRRRKKPPGEKRPTRGGGEIALAEGSLKHLARAAETGALSPERIDDLPPARLERLAVLLEEVAASLARSASIARRLVAEARAETS